MANALSGFSRCLTVMCDSIRVFDGFSSLAQQVDRNQDSDLEKASLVNRMICLGFTIAEVGMILSGQKSQSIKTLKDVEMIPRLINIPLEFVSEVKKVEDLKFRDLISVIQKGMIAPIADVARVAAESEAYYEKSFLEMSPEEFAKAERPIYLWKYNGQEMERVIVGYRPVERDECIRNLQTESEIAATSSLVRLATLLYDVKLPLYDRLFQYVRARDQVGQEVAQQQLPMEVLDLDFRNFPSIPAPLHEDDIFSRFVCPIKQEPIRDPVRDPTTPPRVKVLYERQAILNWIRINHTSPFTRMRLNEADLIECPALKQLIERRLEHHYQALRSHMAERGNDPVSAQDQDILQLFQ